MDFQACLQGKPQLWGARVQKSRHSHHVSLPWNYVSALGKSYVRMKSEETRLRWLKEQQADEANGLAGTAARGGQKKWHTKSLGIILPLIKSHFVILRAQFELY